MVEITKSSTNILSSIALKNAHTNKLVEVYWFNLTILKAITGQYCPKGDEKYRISIPVQVFPSIFFTHFFLEL